MGHLARPREDRCHCVVSVAGVSEPILERGPREELMSPFPAPQALQHAFDGFRGEFFCKGCQFRVVSESWVFGEGGGEFKGGGAGGGRRRGVDGRMGVCVELGFGGV